MDASGAHVKREFRIRPRRRAGRTGEILMRGPQMFGGYLDPAQAGASFHRGWLRSGDLGRSGAEGEVYVTGRAKDIIIRGGHNIDPAAIEDIALAAAVGRPAPFTIRATHEPQGLFLRATTPEAWVDAARAELGKFPVGFEVSAG